MGYHGPPELTVVRALTEWTFDPWALGFVLLLGGLYLAGVRRVRRSGAAWTTGRTVAFCGLGLGFTVIATMSWVGVYASVLFYVRSVQTILALLLIPLFLALGRPLTLAIASLPRTGPRIEALIRSRAARVATFPAISTMVLVIVPFLVYFTPWYAAGFHSTAVRELTHLALIAPGFVFFWTLLRVDPVPKAYPYLVSLWITGAEVVGDAALGLAVIADQSLIAGAYYHALAYPWGPGLATDQVLGGGTLWIFGDLVGLPFLAAMLIQMIREDEAEAKVIDAELDARDAQRAAEQTAAVTGAAITGAGVTGAGVTGAAVTGAGVTGAPVTEARESAGSPGQGHPAGLSPRGAAAGTAAGKPGDTPWWESDPRFTGRFEPIDDGPDGQKPGDNRAVQ
jgi:cytochrome c oxidase assembly factor CtaG